MINVYCELMQSTIRIVNDRINDYLDIYMDFYKNLGPEEGFSSLFPEMIWIENKEKCIKTMIELDAWTRDEHNHSLSPLHEYALHSVLCGTNDELMDQPDWLDNENEQLENISNDDYILRNLDNIDFYLTILFQDHDFLNIADYLSLYFKNPFNFEEEFNVNLDEYVDLMPSDIRIEYLSVKDTLYPKGIEVNSNRDIYHIEDFIYHIEKILDYFEHSITLKDSYKLMWNDNDLPRKEKTAQQLFGLVCKLYCENNNIDITPEAETGRGPVDFKFSYGNNMKAIVEIKLGSNDVFHGLKHQTLQYMLSERVSFAYYVVMILNDVELKKIERLEEIRNHINEEHQVSVKTIIIDARKNKVSASKNRK